MTDATPTQTPRFCGTCGTQLVPNSKFCESCGAPADGRQAPARPASTPPPAAYALPNPAYSQQYYQPYPPPYAVPQLARRSGLPRWVMIAAGAVVVIVLAFIGISALTGGGGRGPTLNEVMTAKNMNSHVDAIMVSKKCTLTDVDKSRGYSRKWIVSYRTDGKYAMVFTYAFVYDGYQWEEYHVANSKTGCPNIE